MPKDGILWIVAIAICSSGKLGEIAKMGPMRKICGSLQFGLRQSRHREFQLELIREGLGT